MEIEVILVATLQVHGTKIKKTHWWGSSDQRLWQAVIKGFSLAQMHLQSVSVVRITTQ